MGNPLFGERDLDCLSGLSPLGPRPSDSTPTLGPLPAPLYPHPLPWQQTRQLRKGSTPAPATAAACCGAIGGLLALSAPFQSPDFCRRTFLAASPSSNCYQLPPCPRDRAFRPMRRLWRHATVSHPLLSSSSSNFPSAPSIKDSSSLVKDTPLVLFFLFLLVWPLRSQSLLIMGWCSSIPEHML